MEMHFAQLIGLVLFYAIQLGVISIQNQNTFLTAINSLMLITACAITAQICRGNSDKETNIILCMNGCLFGFTAGWMCFVAFLVTADARFVIFFAINGIIIITLIITDVRAQQNRAIQVVTNNREEVLHSRESQDVEGNDMDRFNSKPETHDKFHDNLEIASDNHQQVSQLQQSHDTSHNTELTDDNLFDGFRVQLEKLPISNINCPQDVPWESFSYVEHRVDSSSCHIYSAFWKGTTVIIKLIKADRVASSMAIAEFETEASILSRLNHPHIVRLLGTGRYPRRFLILELLDGGSLSHLLGLRAGGNSKIIKKKHGYLDTLLMARSLASALDYLHHQWYSSIHVIHRDLKPDNIGFTADGKLKLFDFGLCTCVKSHSDQKDVYRLTGNTGTLRYMAPEVALGRQYNRSVDVYSFGVIIWQVMRSKVPFRDMGKKAYIQEVVIGGRRPALERNWPKGFSELLEKCWHEDKDARPTFTQVVEELDSLLQEARTLDPDSFSTRINQRIHVTGMTNLSMLRGILMAVTFVLIIVAIVLFSIGDRERGSSLVVVSCASLYIAGLSFVKGRKNEGSVQKEDMGNKTEGFVTKNLRNIISRVRRRIHTVNSSLEFQRRPLDPHVSSSAGTCIGGEENPSAMSFNPLSPHSIHHSSEEEGYEAELQYGIGVDKNEGNKKSRLADEANL